MTTKTAHAALLAQLPTPANDDAMMNECEAAEFLGVSAKTLRNWRCAGTVDLPFYKIGGRSIRYRRGDVITFRNKQRRTSTSDTGIAA